MAEAEARADPTGGGAGGKAEKGPPLIEASSETIPTGLSALPLILTLPRAQPSFSGSFSETLGAAECVTAPKGPHSNASPSTVSA